MLFYITGEIKDIIKNDMQKYSVCEVKRHIVHELDVIKLWEMW